MSESPFNTVSVPTTASSSASLGPTWLACPTCSSGRVRSLLGENVVCENGHDYKAPGGSVAFWMVFP